MKLEINKSIRTLDLKTQKETYLLRIIKKETNLLENGLVFGHCLELEYKYLSYK